MSRTHYLSERERRIVEIRAILAAKRAKQTATGINGAAQGTDPGSTPLGERVRQEMERFQAQNSAHDEVKP